MLSVFFLPEPSQLRSKQKTLSGPSPSLKSSACCEADMALLLSCTKRFDSKVEKTVCRERFLCLIIGITFDFSKIQYKKLKALLFSFTMRWTLIPWAISLMLMLVLVLLSKVVYVISKSFRLYFIGLPLFTGMSIGEATGGLFNLIRYNMVWLNLCLNLE